MAKVSIGDLYSMGYLTGSRSGRGSARSRRERYEAEYELPF